MHTDDLPRDGAFHSYTLRTTSPEDASRFYSDVLGTPVHTGEEGVGVVQIVSLPERARERRAPSHWLGQVGVANPSEVTSRFISAGAVPLGSGGPVEGEGPYTLKDPDGAVLSIGPRGTVGASGVGWHLANVSRLEPAWRCYSETFGWCAIEDGEIPGGLGRFRVFGWEEGGPSVGMMAETAHASHVHPHWLFHFDVPDLAEALDLVRSRGGRVVAGPIESFAARFAACDDPQGAAVAFREPLS